MICKCINIYMFVLVTMATTPRTTGITATGKQFYENTKKYISLTHVTDNIVYKLMHYWIEYNPTYLKIC